MANNGEPIEASVVIGRSREEVFAFYRDFSNLPRFLGDVMKVDRIGRGASRWTIQGPLGVRIGWTVRVTEERANELIRYETVSLPLLKTRWDIFFTTAPGESGTVVREVMTAPLGGVGRAALGLIGKYPDKEVAANLNRLKQLLETGKVTDTSYAVPGKFPLE